MKSLLVFVISLSCLASEFAAPPQPEYLKFFDPAKGFTRPQRNLTNIYLQIAASMECYGSPEPYLRHMQAEHERIAKLLSAQAGHPVPSIRPARMTDEYIDKLVANWNKLSPVLHLDELAKAVGEDAREGIRGTRDKGTVLVDLFNEHQQRVYDDMSRAQARTVGFEQLRASVTSKMLLDRDRVSLAGFDISHRDAISYALVIKGSILELNAKIDNGLAPAAASAVKDAISGVFMDLAEMGHSELEAGIVEWSLK